MRPEPHRLVRRVTGAAIVCTFLAAAVTYPLVAPDDGEPSAQATPTAPADTADSTRDAAQSENAQEAERAQELAGPGIVMVVSPSLGGDLLVTETIRLPEPTDTLVFGPPRLGRAGSQFNDVAATATGVRLRSTGQSNSFPRGAVDGPTRISVPATETAEVSYRLTGATVRSTPSRPGRSTGAVSPLLRELNPDLPVHVVVTGPAVLNLACPLLPVSERACMEGTSLAAQTQTPLAFSEAVVTVQLDLRRT